MEDAWVLPVGMCNRRDAEGNLEVIVVQVCEPVFRNRPHSHTWPLKNGTIHIFERQKC